VEENELLEIAARKEKLIDIPTPFFRRRDVEVSRKVDIHVPGPCPPAHAWRCPGDCFGKRSRPFPDVRIMELVGRHEMTNPTQAAQLLGQVLIELDRRMKEEVAVRETHHRHSGREGKRQPDAADSQIL